MDNDFLGQGKRPREYVKEKQGKYLLYLIGLMVSLNRTIKVFSLLEKETLYNFLILYRIKLVSNIISLNIPRQVRKKSQIRGVYCSRRNETWSKK
jgi:hypothetical protein